MSRAFAGTTHDVALLFALQGSVALDNAELYARAHNVVEQLHRTLESRSMIERAKGLLMGSEGLTSQEAFERLRARSQSEHRKLREVALSLLEAHDPGGASGAPAPWVPSRQRPFG
jgi:AmiR/NasT family two-component response regulator